MSLPTPGLIDGVAHVERIDGAKADARGAPRFLVEVPHGADRRAHYDALRARMVGALPPELEIFFHANTDMGAWQLGRRVAERLVEARPELSALLVRCLIPRTFIDTNRLEDAPERLAEGGLTAGIPPYIREEADRALLRTLHRQYVETIEAAYEGVCGAGGFALSPHTYGPRSMGIPTIDDDIAARLRDAYAPGTWESWPLRAEVDLLTRDAERRSHAPAGMEEALVAAYARVELRAEVCSTYVLAPQTQTWRWVERYAERMLCLEVRRDLLVDEFDLFAELKPTEARIDRAAGPLVEAIDAWFGAQ